MNTTKTMYVLLDSDGDIVTTFPENSNFDFMFEYKRATCPYGTLHKAIMNIGPEEKERIQTNTEQPRRIVSEF